MIENVRPNWGVSFDFRFNNKFGHFVYDIFHTNDEHLNYYLYSLNFKVIYNNKSNAYK